MQAPGSLTPKANTESNRRACLHSITDSSHGFHSIRNFLRLTLLQLHNGRLLACVALACVFWPGLFKAGFTQVMPNLKPVMHLNIKSEFSFLLFVHNLLKNLKTEKIN